MWWNGRDSVLMFSLVSTKFLAMCNISLYSVRKTMWPHLFIFYFILWPHLIIVKTYFSFRKMTHKVLGMFMSHAVWPYERSDCIFPKITHYIRGGNFEVSKQLFFIEKWILFGTKNHEMREPLYVGKIGTLVNLLKLWQNKNNQTFVVMLGFCMSFFWICISCLLQKKTCQNWASQQTFGRSYFVRALFSPPNFHTFLTYRARY